MRQTSHELLWGEQYLPPLLCQPTATLRPISSPWWTPTCHWDSVSVCSRHWCQGGNIDGNTAWRTSRLLGDHNHLVEVCINGYDAMRRGTSRHHSAPKARHENVTRQDGKTHVLTSDAWHLEAPLGALGTTRRTQNTTESEDVRT